jgi:hypothetical protein
MIPFKQRTSSLTDTLVSLGKVWNQSRQHASIFFHLWYPAFNSGPNEVEQLFIRLGRSWHSIRNQQQRPQMARAKHFNQFIGSGKEFGPTNFILARTPRSYFFFFNILKRSNSWYRLPLQKSCSSERMSSLPWLRPKSASSIVHRRVENHGSLSKFFKEHNLRTQGTYNWHSKMLKVYGAQSWQLSLRSQDF